MITTVLFDLDGTLLPMDQDTPKLQMMLKRMKRRTNTNKVRLCE